jgi:hypothetical protein
MQESQPQEKKDEPLEKILSVLKTEFSGDESITFSISDSGQLFVKFIEQSGQNSVDADLLKDVKGKVLKVLENNDFEFIRILSSGNWSFLVKTDSKFVDGKINWRRWVSRANQFSSKVADYLDEISTFTELSELIDKRETDEYGKFCYYVDLAFKKGLINQIEKGQIMGDTTNVFR